MALLESRKRRRGSKNKKKNWRKTDINDVEEFLDDQRLEERTGGPVSEKLDAELFFVDKEDETDCTVPVKKGKKDHETLKCHATLLLDPSIKPLKTGHNAKKTENKEKRKSARAQKAKQQSSGQMTVPTKSKQNRRVFNANGDLWAENETERDSEGIDSFHKQYTRQAVPKPPKHHVKKPSGLDAIEVAHPGQSYNPSFEDHQELVLEATLVEEKKQKAALRLKKALDDRFPSKSEAPTEETYMKEMSAGLFDGNEPRQEFTEEELEKISINPPVRREHKKTEKQRRKEKERKEQEAQRKLTKKDKIKQTEYFRIKSIKKEIKKKEADLQERTKRKEELKEQNKNKPKRLGRVKYEEPDLAVKLSDELEGTLRQLKPEGDLLYDRFKSLQKRNIIKPSVKTKRPKKWGKPKFVEKKSHKEITA